MQLLDHVIYAIFMQYEYNPLLNQFFYSCIQFTG